MVFTREKSREEQFESGDGKWHYSNSFALLYIAPQRILTPPNISSSLRDIPASISMPSVAKRGDVRELC